MSFAHDYLSRLEPFAASLPRVKALHLPPLEAAGSKNGEFCAIELDDGSLGLAYVLLDDTLKHLIDSSPGKTLAGSDAMALARQYATAQGTLKTLGFAAANAITRHLFDRAGYVAPDSADSIGGIDPQPGDCIGMIGYFCPLADRIVAAGASLTVVELKADLAGERDGYVVTTDATALNACNKVISTSTILLNDTLEQILGACTRAERIAMIGPGAGCLPDHLFARGVTLIGGSWIEDRDAFVDALVRGEGWSKQARKSAITTDDYPGWDALVARM